MPPRPGFQGMPYGGPAPPPGYIGAPEATFPTNASQFPPPPQMPLAPSQQPPRPDSQAPNELPVNDRGQPALGNRIPTPISTMSPGPGPATGPTPPTESKPSVSEALNPMPKASAPISPSGGPARPAVAAASSTQASKSGRVVPALPMMVNNRANAPLMPANSNGALGATPVDPPSQPAVASNIPPTQITMEEANRQARVAVANAMAKMNMNVQTASSSQQPKAGPAPIDTSTQKAGEVRASDGSRGSGRGGGRGQRGGFRGGSRQGRKMEIPASDYDFESANAKFNKEDMIKEAIASGSPVMDSQQDGNLDGAIKSSTNDDHFHESLSPTSTEAYNKSSSFFDNISSEAKDREEGSNPSAGRGWKGEEIRKNLETFGQGSVDNGSGYRGRGRGGFRGRGGRLAGGQRGYGYSRGGGYRARARGGAGAVAS